MLHVSHCLSLSAPLCFISLSFTICSLSLSFSLSSFFTLTLPYSLSFTHSHSLSHSSVFSYSIPPRSGCQQEASSVRCLRLLSVYHGQRQVRATSNRLHCVARDLLLSCHVVSCCVTLIYFFLPPLHTASHPFFAPPPGA